MAFEDVKKNLPIWNGMSVKNKDGENIPLEKTDKSFIIGYYMGMDSIKGKDDKDIISHKFIFESCGDPSHLSEDVQAGEEVMLWGSTALNDKLVKNVPIGVLARVEWLGKVASKSNSGFRYHDFLVQLDKDKVLAQAPVQQAYSTSQQSTAPNPVAANVSTSPAAVIDSGKSDDDLPF